jgi:hypothetical protein
MHMQTQTIETKHSVAIVPALFEHVDAGETRREFLSQEARFLFQFLPNTVKASFMEAYPDFKHPSAKLVADYFTENSKIANLIRQAPGSARAFEILYHAEEPHLPIDIYFQMCAAGTRIFYRLISLRETLPRIIRDLLLKTGKDKLVIDNFGSGPGRDIISVLDRNPDLVRRVDVRNVDIDTWSVEIGRKLAAENGFQGAVSYVMEDMRKVPPRNADLLLLIGVLCPLPYAICIRLLRHMKGNVNADGLIVFSTVQKAMQAEDPLTDFIMRVMGWHMDYKADCEPQEIAQKAGWEFVEKFFDDKGYNAMTVAKPVFA